VQGSDSGYLIVPVALPADFVDHLVRRVGPHGLSAYILHALLRQEPMASLVDFHQATAVAMGLRPQLMPARETPRLTSGYAGSG
jgi:hypothetical protein